MRISSYITFAAAVGLGFLAAAHRWPDTAHTVGILAPGGGRAAHPAHLGAPTLGRNLLIATLVPVTDVGSRARVEIVPTGENPPPPLRYDLTLSAPVVDLGLRTRTALHGDRLEELAKRRTATVWATIHGAEADPVCGMAWEERFLELSLDGVAYKFCSDQCRDRFVENPRGFTKDRPRGTHALRVTTAEGVRLLDAPVIFGGAGEGGGGHAH